MASASVTAAVNAIKGKQIKNESGYTAPLPSAFAGVVGGYLGAWASGASSREHWYGSIGFFLAYYVWSIKKLYGNFPKDSEDGKYVHKYFTVVDAKADPDSAKNFGGLYKVVFGGNQQTSGSLEAFFGRDSDPMLTKVTEDTVAGVIGYLAGCYLAKCNMKEMLAGAAGSGFGAQVYSCMYPTTKNTKKIDYLNAKGIGP